MITKFSHLPEMRLQGVHALPAEQSQSTCTILSLDFGHERAGAATVLTGSQVHRDFFAAVEETIEQHNGQIHPSANGKWIVTFAHVDEAVSVGISLLGQLRHRNRLRRLQRQVPLKLGVGISRWHDVSAEALSLDDALNLAHCLSDLNKATPIYTLFLSKTAVSCVPNQPRWTIDSLGSMRSNRCKTAVEVFALVFT